MFRQLKSALFWYYLYRFRRRVAVILTLVMLILLSEYIYSDIVEYLRIRQRTEWLDLVLPVKWIVIFGALFGIFYLLLSLFRPISKEKDEGDVKSEKPPQKKPLSKEQIRSLAQQIIEKKRRL